MHSAKVQTYLPSPFLVTSRSGFGIGLMREGVTTVGESSFTGNEAVRSSRGSGLSTNATGALKVATVAKSATTGSLGSPNRSGSVVGSG